MYSRNPRNQFCYAIHVFPRIQRSPELFIEFRYNVGVYRYRQASSHAELHSVTFSNRPEKSILQNSFNIFWKKISRVPASFIRDFDTVLSH